jgi:hypothetical protein
LCKHHSDDFSIAISPSAASHLLAIARQKTIGFWDTKQRLDVRTITIDEGHTLGALVLGLLDALLGTVFSARSEVAEGQRPIRAQDAGP